MPEAKGRLIVRLLEEILAPKIVPLEPVETEVTTLVPKAMVVEVPIMDSLPSPLVKDRPVPKDRLPKVVVPIPPLATPKVPVTSLEPKAMAPLNRAPEAVDLTGRATLKEERVVEPLPATVKREEPVEEATVKGLTLAPAWTVKVEVLVVVPTAKRLEIVEEPVMAKVEPLLFQRKLAEEAVVEAPVA